MKKTINNLQQTSDLAKEFASTLQKGDVVLLSGDLGAGKTTFTQFVFKFLGVKEVVNSPTFSVLKSYQAGDICLHHFDVYRITCEEAVECGFDEVLSDRTSIIFIEWADNIKPLLPKKYISVEIKLVNGAREFVIEKVN